MVHKPVLQRGAPELRAIPVQATPPFPRLYRIKT
jgi:hypothetical protein